jgi:hypothetical protein
MGRVMIVILVIHYLKGRVGLSLKLKWVKCMIVWLKVMTIRLIIVEKKCDGL